MSIDWPKTKEEFQNKFKDLQAQFSKLEPELEVTVRDPKYGMTGFAVVQNTMPNPGSNLTPCGKGGTRITLNVSLEEIKMLAKKMALKNAAAGLPIGGSKSGLIADPDSENFEQVYRSFVRALKPNLRENGGIFGGFGFDIGARAIHPTWACDELQSNKSFTGKTVEMGGTDYDKEGIAGLGVAVAAQTALKFDKKDINTSTFSVQGLGAMGAAVVKYFSERGANLLAVSDPRIGGSYRLSNPAKKELIDSISIADFDKTKKLIEELHSKNEVKKDENLNQVLFEQVDVAFPCAVQYVINNENVSKIKAKYWAEGANSPVEESAYKHLYENQKVVLPDFIANPGGVIAAYVELSSELTPEQNAKTRGNVVKAKKLTEELISKNVEILLSKSKELNVETKKIGLFISYSKILNS